MTGEIMEGARKRAKSNHPEATLRSGSLPGAVAVPNSLGLKQGKNDAPSGESNHETLRHGKTPQAESVRSRAAHNPETLRRARMLNNRSESGGAEKGGGW